MECDLDNRLTSIAIQYKHSLCLKYTNVVKISEAVKLLLHVWQKDPLLVLLGQEGGNVLKGEFSPSGISTCVSSPASLFSDATLHTPLSWNTRYVRK